MRLVADANVLLSAVIGGRANAVLRHAGVSAVFTTQSVLDEVQEYAAHLAAKKGLSLEVVLLAVATLPVVVVDSEAYAGTVAEAKRRIGRRDPDDVEVLALALHTGAPVWTNDNDFDVAGTDWFTTAELLAMLDSAVDG